MKALVEDNKSIMAEIEKEAKRSDEIIKAEREENTRLKAELYDLMKENEVMRHALAERG